MKSRKNLWTGIFAAFGMFLLILDAKTALAGARDGIELCVRTVIPSLFPFFILSILLTGALLGQPVPVLRPLGKLCGIPAGAESLLLVGLLGGYPVGAQSVYQAYHTGQLSRQDAQRMLGFCNNAGPAFLFGMAGTLFRSPAIAWVLWGIHIVSALPAAILLPGKSAAKATVRPSRSLSPAQALERAVSVMAGVCGWVILFRVIIAILQRWCLWLLPQSVQITVIGLMELSNGCCELANLPGEGLRFLLCACFLGAGGLCVAMQTMSVTGDLGTGLYFPGKGMQAVFSFLLAAIAQQILFAPSDQASIHPAVWTAFLCFDCLLILILKKSSRNPAAAGV